MQYEIENCFDKKDKTYFKLLEKVNNYKGFVYIGILIINYLIVFFSLRDKYPSLSKYIILDLLLAICMTWIFSNILNLVFNIENLYHSVVIKNKIPYEIDDITVVKKENEEYPDINIYYSANKKGDSNKKLCVLIRISPNEFVIFKTLKGSISKVTIDNNIIEQTVTNPEYKLDDTSTLEVTICEIRNEYSDNDIVEFSEIDSKYKIIDTLKIR